MLFLLISDQGIITQPIQAPSLAAATSVILDHVGIGTGQITVAAALTVATATVQQHPTDKTKATLTPTTPDGVAQKAVRDGAKAVIAANTAFINNPNVQPLPDLATQAKVLGTPDQRPLPAARDQRLQHMKGVNVDA